MLAPLVVLGSIQLAAALCSQPANAAVLLPGPGPKPPTSRQATAPDRVTEIRIQGNYRTPEEEVRKLAGVQVGDEVDDEAIRMVQERLEKSGRFDEVQVLKRWRTLDAAGDIVLVILVTERPSGAAGILGHLARAFGRPMVLPIFEFEDGYGLTYGARVSPPDLLGSGTHLSVPVTWGGTRQAAIEINRQFERGPVTFISSTLSIRQRENPHFDIRDSRRSISARAERSFAGLFRAGASGAWSHVDFAELDERLTTWGADAAFDTRKSTDLPRNAVYLSAAWERLKVEQAPALDRYRTDARGYLGLPWGSVLAMRLLRTDATAQLPPYEQYLLGGFSSVRGFRAGYRAGDTMVTATAELRFPLTSPVSFGSAGATLFVDRGTVYADGTKFKDADFLTGVGGGLYFSAAFFKLNVDLARGLERGWRLHVSSGFQF
jgi:hypothetical protein